MHTTFLTVASLFPGTYAWGTLGHDTVAYIAQSYVSSTTKAFAQKILNDTGSSYLASVATWADSYRSTSEGAFSAPYHYIDANDSPPSSCGVEYDRDCPEEGCVVSAIQNYTTRVKDTKLSSTEVNKALKWIIHFVGDIHQPLHDEALEVGGNTIKVTWDGKDTNLHHIWDTEIPEKLVGGYKLTDAEKWAKNLTAEINSGKYASDKASWLQGIDISNAKDSAMVWAKDSNAFVCTSVLKNGTDSVRGQELDGSYYDATIPVVELQIAKAGYRLAAWLDLIATGKVSFAEASAKRSVSVEEMRKGGLRTKIGTTVVQPVKVATWDPAEVERARMARRAFGWDCGHKH